MKRFLRYQSFLLCVFLLLWAVLAARPLDRADWLLENVLVFVFAPLIVFTARYFRLSNLSYTLITLFLTLHVVGAHYTYAKVPWGFTLSEWFGASRNHFDRIVHFSFGFLLSYPIREMFLRVASVRGFWGYFLPLDVTLSMSAIFEILEWLIVIMVSPEAGLAYLGTQGDIWDAQKDMALAGLGAGLAMTLIALANWRYDPSFGRELADSLRVKHHLPLGEVKLRALIRARHARSR